MGPRNLTALWRVAEGSGDVVGFINGCNARHHADTSQGSVWGHDVVTKVLHPALDCKNWAKVRVATAPVVDDLIFDAILLGGEGEGGVMALHEIRCGGEPEVKPVKTYGKLDINQGEWSSIGRRVHVFPGAKEIKEGDDDHVHFSQTETEVGISREVLGDESNILDDGNGDGFDSRSGWVLLFPCC